MLKKAVDIVEALRYPGGFAALLTARPRSLTSWLIANRLHSLGVDFRTVIDGGANTGQFARAAHLCFPQARIISFEPLPDVAEELRANLHDVTTHRVVETALGAGDGRTEFYRHRYSQSSSARRMLASKDGLMRDDRELERLELPLTTLDTALRGENLEPPALLKLDLQGYELEALRGGSETLARCSHVLLETVFGRQYAGEPLFDEVWQHLHEKGFCFDHPLHFLRDRSGRIVQMDGLFSAAGNS